MTVLATLILASSGILIYMYLGGKGRKFALRRLAGFDAIDEAVGRCTELKRPLHFTPGLGRMYSETAAALMAGLSLLSYTAKQCAKYDTQMIVTCCYYEQFPFVQGSVKTEFDNAGKTMPEEYVRFVGHLQGALSVACQGIFEREHIGANLMFGHFDEECVSIAEKGFRVGAMSIGGTEAMGQAAIMAAVMDYILIGEELYAAGAYASGEPTQLGSIAGADLSKMAAMVLVILGAILVNLGIPFAKWLTT
jgi:hypothetical protein